MVTQSGFDLPSNWGPFQYTDFYMGAGAFRSVDVEQSVLRDLYVKLFTQLKAHDLDLHFAALSLGVIRFPKAEPADDPATYNLSRSLAEAGERNAKAFEEAVNNPPLIVWRTRRYTATGRGISKRFAERRR